MKILDPRVLKRQGACKEAVEWIDTLEDKSYSGIFKECIEQNHLEWANWGISRLLSNEGRARYAIYAASQVIDVYEKKFPKDNRPREAIKAARRYLKNPSTYAAYAAYAAADVAYAAYAAYAAADVAYAAKEEMRIKILKYGYRLLLKE